MCACVSVCLLHIACTQGQGVKDFLASLSMPALGARTPDFCKPLSIFRLQFQNSCVLSTREASPCILIGHEIWLTSTSYSGAGQHSSCLWKPSNNSHPSGDWRCVLKHPALLTCRRLWGIQVASSHQASQAIGFFHLSLWLLNSQK